MRDKTAAQREAELREYWLIGGGVQKTRALGSVYRDIADLFTIIGRERSRRKTAEKVLAIAMDSLKGECSSCVYRGTCESEDANTFGNCTVWEWEAGFILSLKLVKGGRKSPE